MQNGWEPGSTWPGGRVAERVGMAGDKLRSTRLAGLVQGSQGRSGRPPQMLAMRLAAWVCLAGGALHKAGLHGQ